MTETNPDTSVWVRHTFDFPLNRSSAEPIPDVPKCCIWDGDPFDLDKVPIKIPIRKEKNGTIIYHGTACSHACALAYMEEHPLIYNTRSQELLIELARTMFNIKTALVRARSIFTLIKYDGYLTIQQFRSYGPQHFSCLQFPPFKEQPIRIEDTLPQGEIRTAKSREEFLHEIQLANEEMNQKKKRHNEKLYQNSLECLMSKRIKTTGPSEEAPTTVASPFVPPAPLVKQPTKPTQPKGGLLQMKSIIPQPSSSKKSTKSKQ